VSNWRNDPEGAAEQLIRRSLDDIEVQGRVLLAYASADLAATLMQRGAEVAVWNRRVVGAQAAAASWPSRGPYDVALLRLPKAKDEQEMAAHACLGTLGEGGRLIVYGGNDEGIRSASGMLEELCGSVDTLATRGHGRVLSVRRPDDAARLRTSLSDWRRTTALLVGGVMRDWASYPGIFADGRIDEGTALLLANLPQLTAGARVLDYGCGSGIIAATALALQRELVLTLMDNDTVALEAARENVPGARIVAGTRIGATGSDPLAQRTDSSKGGSKGSDPDNAATYAVILSNPPLHTGLIEDHAHLERLVADAPVRLAPGGLLQMVVQRRVPLDRMLANGFASATVVAETGSYRVWRAVRDGVRPLASTIR
jgi:16S rRNA (guanine1207-N2)-methyltransferase